MDPGCAGLRASLAPQPRGTHTPSTQRAPPGAIVPCVFQEAELLGSAQKVRSCLLPPPAPEGPDISLPHHAKGNTTYCREEEKVKFDGRFRGLACKTRPPQTRARAGRGAKWPGGTGGVCGEAGENNHSGPLERQGAVTARGRSADQANTHTPQTGGGGGAGSGQSSPRPPCQESAAWHGRGGHRQKQPRLRKATQSVTKGRRHARFGLGSVTERGSARVKT